MSEVNDFNKELEAVKQVLSILESLTDEQRKFVLKTVADRFRLIIPRNQNLEDVNDPSAISGVGVLSAKKITDEMTPKEFIKAKRPDSDVLRATCLAYYLTYLRDQPHFKSEDIATLNTEAAYQNFGNVLKTVNNAMARSHFLAPAGGGKKQITALGEEIVNALPDRAAVTALIKEYKKGRRAKPKKTKSK